MDLASEFGRGLVAGAMGITVGYPFDTVKIHMQLASASASVSPSSSLSPSLSSTSTSSSSSSLLSALRRVVAARGVLALFDGVASPVASYGVLIATNFTCYANAARMLEKQFEPTSQFAVSCCHGVAGMISGGVLSVLSCPFEMVKLRLQSQAAQKHNRPAYMNSTFATAKHMLRTEGLAGFYKGSALPANFIVLSFGSGVYFFTYDSLQAAWKPEGFPSALCMGATTGLFYWLCVFGLDTIKTRVMVDLSSQNPSFPTLWGCFKSLKQGFFFFFFFFFFFKDCLLFTFSNTIEQERGSLRRVFFGPGLSAALIRAAPVNAVMLGGTCSVF